MTNTNITISPGPLKGAWIKWHGSMTALSDEATCYLSSKVKCSCLDLRKSSWSHWSWTGLPWNQRVLCNSEWNVYMKTNRVNIYLYMVVKWLMPQLREDSVVSSYTIMVPLLTSMRSVMIPEQCTATMMGGCGMEPKKTECCIPGPPRCWIWHHATSFCVVTWWILCLYHHFHTHSRYGA
jgi:hypothetical protein